MTKANPTTSRWARIALSLVLAVYGFKLFSDPGNYTLLDSVDLAIHETGHLVFGPFGMFIGFLGGTLFQLIVPVAFVAYFLKEGDKYASSIVFWWVAQNLWNISVYVKDARSQVLPLVGGGEHDWAYLLGELGLLARDQNLGEMIRFFGVLVYGYAIISSLWFAPLIMGARPDYAVDELRAAGPK